MSFRPASILFFTSDEGRERPWRESSLPGDLGASSLVFSVRAKKRHVWGTYFGLLGQNTGRSDLPGALCGRWVHADLSDFSVALQQVVASHVLLSAPLELLPKGDSACNNYIVLDTFSLLRLLLFPGKVARLKRS